MTQISKSFVLLFVLIITACTTAPLLPGSLAALHQQTRKAIETECVRELLMRQSIYRGVDGNLFDVLGYCEANARSRAVGPR